jgi:hypothetical protein
VSVKQLESAILALPPEERQQILEWCDAHRHELLAPPAPESDAVKQELLRRRQEYIDHPERFVTMNDADWDKLEREVDEELRKKTSARQR